MPDKQLRNFAGSRYKKQVIGLRMPFLEIAQRPRFTHIMVIFRKIYRGSFIFALALMLSCAGTLASSSAAFGAPGIALARCTALKRSLSPGSQRTLAEAERRFDAALFGKQNARGDELRSLAQTIARQAFPKARDSQANALAAIIMADWWEKQRPEIERLQTKVRGNPRAQTQTSTGIAGDPHPTDNELGMIRLNELLNKRMLVEEQIGKLLNERDETTQDLLDNF